MVEQSGEPLLLSFLCCLPHTVQPLEHALPALCRVHVRLNDVLLRLCPSLPNLRRRSPSLVRLARRYYKHSPTSPARACPHCGLWPSRTGLDRQTKACWRSPGSRACCFSACAGSQTTQDPTATRDCAAAVLPSSYSEWSRHPDLRAFRSSIAPPTDASVSASRNTSRSTLQDSRSESIHYFLSCRALASPTTCRFSPALSGLPEIQSLADLSLRGTSGGSRGRRMHWRSPALDNQD